MHVFTRWRLDCPVAIGPVVVIMDTVPRMGVQMPHFVRCNQVATASCVREDRASEIVQNIDVRVKDSFRIDIELFVNENKIIKSYNNIFCDSDGRIRFYEKSCT